MCRHPALQHRIDEEEQAEERNEQQPAARAAGQPPEWAPIRRSAVPRDDRALDDNDVLDGVREDPRHEACDRIDRDTGDEDEGRALVEPLRVVRAVAVAPLLADDGREYADRDRPDRDEQPAGVRPDVGERCHGLRVRRAERDAPELVSCPRGRADDEDRAADPREQQQPVQPSGTVATLARIDPAQAVALLHGVHGVPDRRDGYDDPEVESDRDRHQDERDDRAPREQPSAQVELFGVAVHEQHGQRLVQQADDQRPADDSAQERGGRGAAGGCELMHGDERRHPAKSEREVRAHPVDPRPVAGYGQSRCGPAGCGRNRRHAVPQGCRPRVRRARSLCYPKSNIPIRSPIAGWFNGT